MKQNRQRLVAGLLLLFLLWSMVGCGSSPDYSSIDIKGQKVLWITCDWTEDTQGQVTVRRYKYDKESKDHVLAEELQVPPSEDRNDHCLLVEQQGIYEIVLTAAGYETQSRMVEVDENAVYRVIVHMPPLENSP